MDFVTICTPSGAHMEPGIAAANAGKNTIYSLYEDRNDDKQWSFNTILNTIMYKQIILCPS